MAKKKESNWTKWDEDIALTNYKENRKYRVKVFRNEITGELKIFSAVIVEEDGLNKILEDLNNA